MNNERVAKRLPIDIPEALRAICAYGKGRCWYCDVKLPPAERAIRAGWNVERVEAQPVASIILVCPRCARQKARSTKTEARSQKSEVRSRSRHPSPSFGL